MKYLDIEQWNRRDHFRFFSSFEEPFFGLCVDVDVTNTYNLAKADGTSFYLTYLHKSLVAANTVIPFRYRTNNEGQVEVYDFVDGSATVLREDGTFGFSHIVYNLDFEEFVKNAKAEISRVQQTEGLDINVAPKNVIQLSTLPWVKFTSMSHARSFGYRGSNPMISFGKVTDHQGQKTMPVSVHVHHGLMDGLHVGEYFEIFQKLLNEK